MIDSQLEAAVNVVVQSRFTSYLFQDERRDLLSISGHCEMDAA
jgi:hypothetical protein